MTHLPVLRAVVFDLDGTIADTFPMAIDLIGEMITSHGGPALTPTQIVALFGPNEKGIFQKVLGEGWEEAWRDYRAVYVARHSACPEPFPGMKSLIEELDNRGCRLGLITGKTTETGRLSLQVFGLEERFDAVEGGATDGVVKAQCLLHMLQAWELQGDEVAYVGDTETDMNEARAAGVIALGAAWAAHSDTRALAAAQTVFGDVASFARWVLDRVPG